MPQTNDTDELWVFGYGSLMWNPGFDYDHVEQAKMMGVHRSACIYSWVHRGTPERPGIVLGLAPGGACVGKAFKVKAENKSKTIDYLRARELVTNVYLETTRMAHLQNGEKIKCLTYLADPAHEQYAGRLNHDALVKQIKGAVGKSGPNEAYIIDTAKQLDEMGIHDSLLSKIAKALY